MGDSRTQHEPSVEEVHRRNGNIEITSSDAHPGLVRETLEGHINERGGLKERFYKGGPSEDHIKQAEEMFEKLEKKGCSNELALSLSILVLYDLVILIDDSLSMRTAEGGNRIKALESTLLLIAEVYTLARSDGILAIDFLNDSTEEVDVGTDIVAEIISEHSFSGWTRIGTELKQKVLDDFVKTDMEKPLLVITIIDGGIEGEDENALVSVIDKCVNDLKDGPHGELGAHAVSFQFARVGDDQAAADLLRKIDDDKTIDQYVDCLPVGIEVLLDKKMKWATLAKMLLGGMVRAFDQADGSAVGATRGLDDVKLSKKIRRERRVPRYGWGQQQVVTY